MNILVTGGNGFIGSHLVNFLIKNGDNQVINVDSMTYASNANHPTNPNYFHYKYDINNYDQIKALMFKYRPYYIYHLAAESHVDRSIFSPEQFLTTNVNGTFSLLKAATEYHKETNKLKAFVHVSTDEVYGSLNSQEAPFTELSQIKPSSPYSASKASSDHLALSWHRTFGLPVIVTNCSNNYGPLQHSEKFIPTIINNALNNKKIPIYGKGNNIRDWLYVEDHIKALMTVAENGSHGERYNIGGDCELSNIELTDLILKIMSDLSNKFEYLGLKKLISFVEDRKGHDFRYAINSEKLKSSFGWNPTKSMKDGLMDTIKYYQSIS